MEIWKLKSKIDEISLMINCPALIREDPSRFDFPLLLCASCLFVCLVPIVGLLFFSILSSSRRGHLSVLTSRPRSPSPPPVYDDEGKRTNTRPQRQKDKLVQERHTLVTKLAQLDPTYRPPPGYKYLLSTSRSADASSSCSLFSLFRPPRFETRVPIPVDEYPDINFIGPPCLAFVLFCSPPLRIIPALLRSLLLCVVVFLLTLLCANYLLFLLSSGQILGPRGLTQKRMERESGARIIVRGKGSKDGKPSGRIRPSPVDNEPLHVFIFADTQAKVDKAVEMVKPLLIPTSVRLSFLPSSLR